MEIKQFVEWNLRQGDTVDVHEHFGEVLFPFEVNDPCEQISIKAIPHTVLCNVSEFTFLLL